MWSIHSAWVDFLSAQLWQLPCGIPCISHSSQTVTDKRLCTNGALWARNDWDLFPCPLLLVCGWGTSDWCSMLHCDCLPFAYLGSRVTSLEQPTFCMITSFPSVAMGFCPVSSGNSGSFRLCLQPFWCWLLTASRHVSITVVTYLYLGNIVPSECGLVTGCQHWRHVYCNCDGSSCLGHWRLFVTATHSASLHLDTQASPLDCG